MTGVAVTVVAVTCALIGGGAAGWMLAGVAQRIVAPRWASARHRLAMALAAAACAAAVAAWAAAPRPFSVAAALTLTAYVVLAVVGVPLAVIDVAVHRLPDAIVLPTYPVIVILLAVACVAGAPWRGLVRALAAGAAMAAFYLVLHAMGPHGMGAGDVKLAGLLGVLLGWTGWDAVVVGVFAAFVLGGLFAAALVVLRRAGRRTAVAFGPWMLAGAWTGILAAPAWGVLSTAAAW